MLTLLQHKRYIKDIKRYIKDVKTFSSPQSSKCVCVDAISFPESSEDVTSLEHQSEAVTRVVLKA